MIKTLEDVSSNKYTNRFVEIAKSYGLEGSYIRHFSSATKQEEIYFVCGLDADKVNAKNLNVEALLADKQKKYLNHNPHIAAFKITGNDALLTHQAVVEYCQTSEFLNKLYKEYNMELPALIPHGIVSGLKMAHHNSTNPGLSKDVRNIYKKDIYDTLQKQKDLFTETEQNREKARYYLYWQYDSQRSKLANWFKRKFSKDKNRVSMAHLIYTCKETTTVGIHASDAKKVQAELRNRPDIIYWMADKAVGEVIKCPDGQGYGSSKENDRRYIAFSFDSEYCADFLGIVNRIEHPEAYQTTFKELSSKYAYIQHISIPSDEYGKYTAAMDSRGVKYCICDTSSDPSIIDFAIACDIEKNVTDILDKISADAEQTHLYQDLASHRENAIHNFFDRQQTKLETRALEGAKELFGSSDVELVSVKGDFINDEVEI